MALLIFSKKVGPALVFELHGTLNHITAEKLSPQVTHALDEGEHMLIFDLSKLTFISSPGLTIFLTAYRRLHGVGHLRLAGLQEIVRQVFNVTGLATRVEIYPTVEEALVGPTP